MKIHIRLMALLVCFWAMPFAAAADNAAQPEPQQAGQAVFPEVSYEFAPVVEGTKVTHDFVVQNKGAAILNINRIKTG